MRSVLCLTALCNLCTALPPLLCNLRTAMLCAIESVLWCAMQSVLTHSVLGYVLSTSTRLHCRVCKCMHCRAPKNLEIQISCLILPHTFWIWFSFLHTTACTQHASMQAKWCMSVEENLILQSLFHIFNCCNWLWTPVTRTEAVGSFLELASQLGDTNIFRISVHTDLF